ncbi:Uncharacterised protein [Mycobacteroides abscessus subsp. abscessus]|nr:Uncharacterised protein [Mycobacteroides abscessus subsp. abscessus]
MDPAQFTVKYRFRFAPLREMLAWKSSRASCVTSTQVALLARASLSTASIWRIEFSRM